MSEENNNVNNQTAEDCTHNCSSCGSSCSSRSAGIPKEPMNQYSNVKKVIGVISGKGGVGKSLVTSYLSVLMNRKGYNTAILDADITGPSIPKSFGIKSKATGNEMGIIPAVSKNGTEIMSVNLLLDDDEMPVIWRGPVIAGTVKQFWTDVLWGDVDYMFVDMPPGTGDVALTVFQSLPLDGIIIVTSPQELVSMIVAKAVNMAKAMNVPILGIVENYSYIECPDCKKQIPVFGESHVEESAAKYQLKVLAKLPLDARIASLVDKGQVEDIEWDKMDRLADFIEQYAPVEKSEGDFDAQLVAVVTDGNNHVEGHFGHAKEFSLYNIHSDGSCEKTVCETEGCGHEAISSAIINSGAKVLICGGLGGPAMQLLMSNGVLVIPGASGDADVCVQAFLDGALNGSDIPTCGCDGHHDEEAHSCGCGGNNDEGGCGCH